jgi:hypothetical protein
LVCSCRDGQDVCVKRQTAATIRSNGKKNPGEHEPLPGFK